MTSLHTDDPDASGVLPAGTERVANDPPVVTYAPPASLSPVLSGSVGRGLLWLALPVLGEQVLNTLVGLTDLFLAGYVGAEATVAVGLATQFGWLAGIIFGLVGTAATALVARAWGQRAYDDAAHASAQAVMIATAMGLSCAAGVLLVAPIVPALFGLHSEAAALAVTYLRIDAFGHVLGAAMFVGNACLRGAGDTRSPLRTMAIVNVCNIIVSASLTMGVPGVLRPLGVTGIATGTAVAKTIGGLLVLTMLAHGRRLGGGGTVLRLRRRQMAPDGGTIRRLLRVGIPAGADGVGLWIGQLIFVRIINGLASGDVQTWTYAAHIICIRIESFSFLPALAWATAAATMVGQSLGARTPDRAAQGGRLAATQGAVLAFVLGAIYFVFAPQLLGLLTNEPNVVQIGTPAMRLMAFFQIPLALMIIFPGALRGAGDTRYPLLFVLAGMAMRLPLAYVCGLVLGWGLPGAYVGMCADMSLRAILATWRFRHGGWKRTRV